MLSSLKKSLTIILILGIIVAFSGILQAAEPAKIDINKASVEELVQLKGIGPKYAERILEYRENKGNFGKIEDLMKVKGISQKKFDAIKDQIFIRPDEK